MAIYKCKMCGGDLNIGSDAVVVECDYCGTTQTVPTADNEKKLNLFNRANRLRLNSEFDKAAGIYESIIAEFPEEAEAYWGLCLCNYGIEYVDDPATGNKVPTCHRASFEKLASDENFNIAMEYADVVAQKVYRDEAREIDRIMEEILSVSKNEKPYDVFICYKETDDKGERTIDSVLAQDVYDALAAKGLKVFFARISLEDKLGKMYEPYIFAALNSAKVMLAIGTKYEHFHAVWVKNEWSRFLKIMAKDKSKALIPCYKDMDAYDMPDEFKALQAQDMGKIGFMQDLIRGVEKIIKSEKPQTKVVKETATIVQSNANAEALLKRAFMAIEDGEFAKADQFCEQALNIDPENAQAYLGKLMAELKVKKQSDLRNREQPFDGSNNYQKVIRFADDNLRNQLEEATEFILKRNKDAELSYQYSAAKSRMKTAVKSADFAIAGSCLEKIAGYKDSDNLAKICEEKRKEYSKKEVFKKNKRKKMLLAIFSLIIIIILFIPFWTNTISPAIDYNKASKLAQSGKYDEAKAIYVSLGDYKDSAEQTKLMKLNLQYNDALELAENNKYPEAIAAFGLLGTFKDSAEKINELKYNQALELEKNGNLTEAAFAFGAVSSYKDARQKSFSLWDDIAQRKTFCKSEYHAVYINRNGTVVALGDNPDQARCQVNEWTDIIEVSASYSHTVGLKSDGTVVVASDCSCDVSGWTDIVSISAGSQHIVGLKADGTVVATGKNREGECDVSGWKDIIAISAGYKHTVGLKADGTVVAVGDNEHGRCDVSRWTDIVAVSASFSHTAALKSDGTVVAVGFNYDHSCYVNTWTDIVSISTGDYHTVGLKSDGTVVATEIENYGGRDWDKGQCKTEEWSDIIAVFAGDTYTVGTKSDGTVVEAGYDFCDKLHNVNGWCGLES